MGRRTAPSYRTERAPLNTNRAGATKQGATRAFAALLTPWSILLPSPLERGLGVRLLERGLGVSLLERGRG